MKYLTKRKAFLFSLLFLSVPLSAIIMQETCDYNANGWCWENWTFLGDIGKVTLWPAILFFTLTLITFTTKPNTFETWKRFAVWGIPALLVLTYLVTRDTGGSNFFSMDFSLYFLAIIYGLFFLSSLAVIIFTTFKKN